MYICFYEGSAWNFFFFFSNFPNPLQNPCVKEISKKNFLAHLAQHLFSTAPLWGKFWLWPNLMKKNFVPVLKHLYTFSKPTAKFLIFFFNFQTHCKNIIYFIWRKYWLWPSLNLTWRGKFWLWPNLMKKNFVPVL